MSDKLKRVPVVDLIKQLNHIDREYRQELKDALTKDYADDVTCPFCNEGDFDLIGLKGHLSHGDCEAYNATEKRGRAF